jgi:hypothetical protein
MKQSKFYKAPTFKERLTNLKYTILFWKGRKKGAVHTMDIGWREIKPVFFPKGFYDKYSYLGAIPYNEEGEYFKAIYPLVLAMDYEAKPKWCPRWFLRFLDLFGNDGSIVRVRNWTLHNLHRKLTKGMCFVDYKTKWSDHDLRISIMAPEHLQNLADDIENGFYIRGYREELIQEIKQLDPTAKHIWGTIDQLRERIIDLEQKQNKSLE